MTEYEIKIDIMSSSNAKATQGPDIPVEIFFAHVNVFLQILCEKLNRSIELRRFPGFMKVTDIMHVFRKVEEMDRKNYRFITISTNLSKVSEVSSFCLILNFSNIMLQIRPRFS